MPVYQVIIEVEKDPGSNELIDHVEYVESRLLIDAAKAGDEYAIKMEGELKSVRYATPTPTKI